MATSVHIPKLLLERVDARARSRGVSPNRLIIEALEQTLSQHESWSSEFLAEMLTTVDAGLEDGARDLTREILSARQSKKAPPF